MDIYEKQIDKLMNNIEELNLSNEDKIKYLKLYMKMLEEKKSEIENNFIMGTFISGIGLGTMLSDPYLSALLVSSGIIISLYKSKELNKEITINDLKEYKRSR